MSLTYREERLMAFLTDSNTIEDITRPPTDAEMDATKAFLNLEEVTIGDLCNLVTVYAPGHVLRSQVGVNVRVGTYHPPVGGPRIVDSLTELLTVVNRDITTSPWSVYMEYETIHPFTDGNGRSGRTLWAWHMLHRRQDPFFFPFLRYFYYQTLKESRL